MAVARIIWLNAFEIECAVCDGGYSYDPAGPSFGVPMYESEILPDDDAGEWCGKPVCPRCYFLVRGIQSEAPYNKKRLSVALVRQVLNERAGTPATERR